MACREFAGLRGARRVAERLCSAVSAHRKRPHRRSDSSTNLGELRLIMRGTGMAQAHSVRSRS